MPSVSVIIPNWNGMKFLGKCLDSIKESVFTDYEIIVVDNDSTDGSKELVKKTYPEVQQICLKKNYGFARACNEGILASRGDLVVLLNNDIEVEPMWLGELKAGMDRHPECGMGTSKMNFLDERDILYNTGDTFQTWCHGGGRGLGERDTGQYEKEEHVFGACAGAGIYRKSMLDKIGLFDEDFFIFSEDVDLNLRAQYLGFKCIYLPKAKVYHIGTATVGFHSDRHVFLFTRNDLFVLFKNYSLDNYLHFFFFFVFQRLRLLRRAARAGQGWILLKAQFSFLRYFFRMFMKRAEMRGKSNLSMERFRELVQ